MIQRDEPTKVVTIEDLVQFVRSYSEPIEIRACANDLHCLGKYGASWPKASVTHWERELRSLVKSGHLIRSGCLITAPNIIERPSLANAEDEVPLLDYITAREIQGGNP